MKGKSNKMENAVTEFKATIRAWLDKYQMPQFDIGFCEDDFCFDDDNKVLYFGTTHSPDIEEWFAEYLSENGCNWEGIQGPVLSFLHELGHANTMKEFNMQQLGFCLFTKNLIGQQDDLDEKEASFAYWDVPDEWAANEWAINFINEHIDAVVEFTDILADVWEKLIASVDIHSITHHFAEL